MLKDLLKKIVPIRDEEVGASLLAVTYAFCIFLSYSILRPVRYDGLMVAHAISRTCSNQRPRFLVADWLVTLPFVQPYLARLGGVRACRENAERLIGSGKSVVVFPEGQKGAAITALLSRWTSSKSVACPLWSTFSGL